MLATKKLQKVFIALFFTYFFFGMHIVLATPGGYGLYLAPNVIGWMFISIFVSLGFFAISKAKSIFFYKDFKLLLLVLVLLLFPILFSQQFKLNGITKLIAVFGAGLFFFSLFQFRFTAKQRKILLTVLYIGIGIEVLIGMCQFFILSLFDINIVGYTPIYGRPYGSFTQPNVMSSFVNTGIAISFYFVAKGFCESLTKKTVMLIFILFSSILIVLLQSKTGYLTLLLVLIFFIPAVIKAKHAFIMPMLSVLAGGGLGVLSQVYLANNDIKDNIYSDQGVRSNIYVTAVKMSLDGPLEGYGYGNFERKYREYHIEQMLGDETLPPPLENLEHPHNEILLWIIEGGLFAFFAIMVFVLFILKVYIKQRGLSMRFMFLALISPILIHSQLEYPFSHSIVHLVTFLILTWYFINEILEEDKITSKLEHCENIHVENTLSVRAFGWCFSFAVVPFMLTTLHTAYLMEQFKISNNQKTEFISAIINPYAWQPYYEQVIYTQGLVNGYKNRNAKALERYINWGQEFVMHTPRESIYKNMLGAIRTLKKTNNWENEKLERLLYNEYNRMYNFGLPQ